MNEQDLYDMALKEVTKLAIDVLEQCCDFANKNNYDRNWVIEGFLEQFQKAKKDL